VSCLVYGCASASAQCKVLAATGFVGGVRRGNVARQWKRGRGGAGAALGRQAPSAQVNDVVEIANLARDFCAIWPELGPTCKVQSTKCLANGTAAAAKQLGRGQKSAVAWAVINLTHKASIFSGAACEGTCEMRAPSSTRRHPQASSRQGQTR
jgi:hypothetical protein